MKPLQLLDLSKLTLSERLRLHAEGYDVGEVVKDATMQAREIMARSNVTLPWLSPVELAPAVPGHAWACDSLHPLGLSLRPVADFAGACEALVDGLNAIMR